jgi:hypothetical protein
MTEGEGVMNHCFYISFSEKEVLKKSNELVGVIMASSEGSSLSVSGQKPNPTLEPESYLGFLLFKFCNF